jgi:hypothetical protein
LGQLTCFWNRILAERWRGPVKEGWCGDYHLILFNDAEASLASDTYEITKFLPGYKVIGLRGWDDFILQDSNGDTHCVPTVPAIKSLIAPYALPSVGFTLDPDDRFHGKIKWYLKPIIFGGDASLGANIIWVSHDQHAQLVKYWNNLYQSVKGR